MDCKTKNIKIIIWWNLYIRNGKRLKKEFSLSKCRVTESIQNMLCLELKKNSTNKNVETSIFKDSRFYCIIMILLSNLYRKYKLYTIANCHESFEKGLSNHLWHKAFFSITSSDRSYHNITCRCKRTSFRTLGTIWNNTVFISLIYFLLFSLTFRKYR